MRKDKYKLTDINRGYLRSLRKKSSLSAEDVSVELGYSKAWLGQIERGKLQTIKQYDLARIMAIYCPEYTPEELLSKGLLDNYLNYGLLIENMDEHLSDLKKINFADTFYKCIEQLATEDAKENMYYSIKYFMDCINDYPGTMNTLLAHSSLLLMVFENYSVLPADQYLSNINSFSQKLIQLIREEVVKSDSLAIEHLKNNEE